MDPLSIAASIIALVGAAQKVAAGLEKLASLRGAPTIILQLNNELADLRLILSEGEPLILKHAATKGPTLFPNADATWKPSIERAKQRLTELEVILSNRLMSRMGVMDKLGWLREQDKVRRVFDELRNARQNIVAMLSVIYSSTSFRLETCLQNVQSTGEQHQAEISAALTSQRETMDKAFAYMVAAQHEYNEVLQGFKESFAVTSAESNKVTLGSPLPYPGSARLQPKRSSRTTYQVDTFSTLRMRFLRRRKCDVWCKCKCHTYVRTSTSDKLQSVMGELFIGYAGLPALTPACTENNCQRSSEGFLQINYYFPWWFFAKILHIGLAFQQDSAIPRMSIHVLNVRDTYEDIFISARFNDVDSVEYQLTMGRASVFDVTSDSGHSPLHYAMGKNQVEVVKVLLGMGADPYLENKTQESPYDMAWNSIFGYQGTPCASIWRIDEIRALFPDQESAEEKRKFSRLHKIILKILHIDLEKELQKDRSIVDCVDANGRTPLSWAAARGDSECVEILLRHGASPDTPDRIGQGPLRQAMKAHDATCAKLLLAHGAKVDQTDNWDQTCLLSAMFYPNPVAFARPLLEAGANVNTSESLGQSPLTEAVRENHPEAVRMLLAYGAEVDHVNHAGCTALHLGVHYNSHESLKVLFDNADIDHSIRDKRNRTVMHWAAEFADLTTLSLLKHERLHGLDPKDEDDSRLTAIDIAKRRSDEETSRGSGYNVVNSEWLATFSGLLESLMSFKTPKSVLSYTGSVVSEDTLFYTPHDLPMEKLFDLADEEKDPYDLTTFNEELAAMDTSMAEPENPMWIV